MHTPQTITALAALLPLAQSAAINLSSRGISHAPRDEIHKDIIRLMKCTNLVKIVPEVGGFERGQFAYWADDASTSPPDDRVTFDMNDRIEDSFWNGYGNNYGGKTEQDADMVAELETIDAVKPDKGTYAGFATRTVTIDTKTVTNRYNCFVNEDFEYEDDKISRDDGLHPDGWGMCYSYIECVQRDGMKLQFLGSDDVTTAWELMPGKEIYSKFDEVYSEEQGLCKEDKLSIDAKENTCTVQFQCNSHGNPSVMTGLREELTKLATYAGITKEEEVDARGDGQCELRGDCLTDATELHRSVPNVINLAAHTINDDGGFNAAVAEIKAIVECEKDESKKDTICESLASVFSAGGMIKKFSALSEFAGVVVEIGCTIAGAADARR